jgi:multidrug efflux pump subunit AcrA (membrane-fusion protein)
LDVLDRQVELATTRVDLQRLLVLKGRLTDLNLLGALSLAELEEVTFQVEEAEEFLRQAERVLDESRAQLAESRERLEEFKAGTAMAEPDEARLLAALNAEVGVIEARLRSAETALTSLVLRSPLAGRVVAAPAPAGSDVLAGIPVAEVAAVETATLIAWVPQDSPLRPREGDAAEVFVAAGQSEPMTGDVRRVAGAVLPMPLRLLRNPQVPEYGVPVQIELRNGVLPTGQTVRVTFRR